MQDFLIVAKIYYPTLQRVYLSITSMPVTHNFPFMRTTGLRLSKTSHENTDPLSNVLRLNY